MLAIGVPDPDQDPVNLFPDQGGSCTTPDDQPFFCVPTFMQSTTPTGDYVNLVYFVVTMDHDGEGFIINGQLVDRHGAEAAAANLFTVPIDSPIMGDGYPDTFAFSNLGCTFSMKIVGDSVTGTISGQGRSVAGFAPQTGIIEASFSGSKQ